MKKLDVMPAKGRNFEDKKILFSLEKILKDKRGYVFKMPQKNSSVVLLLSGGLDSISLWSLLMGKFGLRVYPLHLYDSKREIGGPAKAIKYFSNILKKKYPQLFNPVFEIEDKPLFLFKEIKDKYKIFHDLPNIINNLAYVPSKKGHMPMLGGAPPHLAFFTLKAYEYAHFLRYKENVLINTIFLGIIPEDSGYLREASLTSFRAINLYFCLGLGNFEWQVSAPIEREYGFYMPKAEIVEYAVKSGLLLEKTWSCRLQNYFHCGICANCITRRAAFKVTGFKDKTVYKRISLSSDIRKLGKRILYYFYKLPSKLIKKKKITNKDLISPDRIISINKKTIWHKNFPNSIYVLNPDVGIIEQFNSTGSLIWGALVEKDRLYSDLVVAVKNKHEHINQKIIQKDILRFLKMCLRKDYLTLS